MLHLSATQAQVRRPRGPEPSHLTDLSGNLSFVVDVLLSAMWRRCLGATVIGAKSEPLAVCSLGVGWWGGSDFMIKHCFCNLYLTAVLSVEPV